ncbi:MAG: Sua5/YciO/YrdC/YwlC family protein [Gammaproteobacteria bacterium]
MLTISDAVTLLRSGKIVVVPTESVYGLSVDPRNEDALQSLLDLKARNPSKGFIVVASNLDALSSLIEPFSEEMASKILSTWPGPCTWIVPARHNLSSLLCGQHASLAVRVTSHPVLKALCDAFGGALVSTSANQEGRPPARTMDELQLAFETCPPIVAGELGELSSPTPIYDALTGQIIRS